MLFLSLSLLSIVTKPEGSKMLKSLQYTLAVIIMAQPLSGTAYTRDDHLAWLKANQEAQPQFVVGETITYDKADLLRPFIPKA